MMNEPKGEETRLEVEVAQRRLGTTLVPGLWYSLCFVSLFLLSAPNLLVYDVAGLYLLYTI